MVQPNSRGRGVAKKSGSHFFLGDQGEADEVSGWMLKQKIWHIKARCAHSKRWVIHVQDLPRKVRAAVLAKLKEVQG